jgi:hypothetical protein
MNSTSVSMEMSVAYMSWITDQLRDDIESRTRVNVSKQKSSAFRRFVVAGVACISMALAQIISS